MHCVFVISFLTFSGSMPFAVNSGKSEEFAKTMDQIVQQHIHQYDGTLLLQLRGIQ